MVKKSDTIYPQLSSRYSKKMLQINFTPTAAEIAFVRTKAKQSETQKLLLVLLKSSQYLHYVSAPASIPYTVIKFLVAFLDAKVLQKKAFQQYQKSGTYKRHCQIVQTYLQFNVDSEKRQEFCLSSGTTIAQSKDQLVDVINALIELMAKQQFELPAFSTIEKWARTCRAQANENLYQKLCCDLESEQITRLNSLLQSEEQHTPWQRLKKTPDKPTPTNIRDFIAHIRWLKKLTLPLPALDVLPISKRQHFYDEAMSLHSSDMKTLKQNKRLALIITLAKSQLAQAFDDLTDMLIRVVNEVEQTGKSNYKDEMYETKSNADSLITQFKEVLSTYQSSRSISKALVRLDTIDKVLAGEAEAMLLACDEHLNRNKYAEKPQVIKTFRKKRRLLFQILFELPIDSVSSCVELIMMGQTLKSLYQKHKHEMITLSLSNRLLKKLSGCWSELILSQEERPQYVNRYALETAWFLTLARHLKTMNCFVLGSKKHADPNEQLISWDEYSTLVESYARHRNIPTQSKEFVKNLKLSLTTLANDIDKVFPEITGVKFDKNGLVLKRAYTDYRSDTLEPLRHAVTELMPKASIIDVLSDTVRWLDLDTIFTLHSGHESKIGDLKTRLIVALFCYGCNVGAQQTMNSVKGLSRKQIAWLNSRFTTTKTLEKAIKRVVDIYSKMDLPNQWGTGKHASADGTHRPMYDANLLSEFHFRYRKRGAIGYYVVSDKYIALFSHFIACGVHESWHILDGVARNEMAITPKVLHGDTHAQNYVVFALSYLLGIELMPRIRGVKSLCFYKPSSKTTYKNINPLFKETIRWQTIEKGVPDMLRLVLSIQEGKMPASALLSRLNTYNSKSYLFDALQELGKVVRTLYLLRNISDMEMRKIIHRETNKSEQFNEFAKWLFFGNEGIIRHNDRFEQEKIIKYHHLVTTLMVLFNTHHMTKALKQLKQNDFPLNKEDIKHLSPYQRFSTNLLGNYQLDLYKELEPILKNIDL